MRKVSALVFVALLSVDAVVGDAGEVVFDVGAAQNAVRVECAGDPLSSETYPAWAFGPWYPEGTLMAASLERGACADWPNVPDECIGVFIANLYPYSNCGCNFSGVLDLPTTIELHYDPERVRAAGADEESLRLYAFGIQGPVWTPVTDARVDSAANSVTAHASGFVIGLRWYAISGARATTPVSPASWSAVRSLYR